ncbi:hypothetical protein PMI21_04464 [Pseudomonas sp. GM18]|uniref:hypothetical protein n=1 Tax=Pseudomonas sp. GM18 TaxID=1144324 RepID=UPI0002725B33|nr:hypothetical protein [Pseudomonas sp. GM18]EJM12908.1 hypothetical protein PMI21_04464 [Pseudomonas sp. GM18]
MKRYTLVTAGMKATLEFLNTPYRVAPLGRLTDIELKLVNENGDFIKEAKVYLTIPNNFKYADGSTGRREFKTSLFGELKVGGVTGPDAPSTAYTIKAEYDGKAVNAKLNVTARGKVGDLEVGFISSPIAVSPDGTKICAMNASNTNGRLVMFDTASFQAGTTVEMLNGNNFSVAPDSNHVVISGSYSYALTNINLATGEQDSIRVSSYNHGACAWDVEGRHVYVVHGVGLTKVDTITKREKRIFEMGSSYVDTPVLRSVDGRRVFIFVSNFSNSSLIRSFDTSADALIRTSASFSSVSGFALSPDGIHIYTSFNADRKIKVFDSVSLSEIRSVDASKPGALAMSPDGRLLFFASEEMKVSAMDTVSLQVVKTFNVAGDPKSLALSPCGSRLYVAYKAKTFITVIQVE